MLKKTITYMGFDDVEYTEDFYFNISKAELIEMELGNSEYGGFAEKLQYIVRAKNGREIIDTFKELILMSVGERSPDGKRFVKNKEISDNFAHTDAYSVMFTEMATDADAGARFIAGVVPADLAKTLADNPDLTNLDKAIEALDDEPDKKVNEETPIPSYIREDRDPTKEEMRKMSQEEMMEAFQRKNKGTA